MATSGRQHTTPDSKSPQTDQAAAFDAFIRAHWQNSERDAKSLRFCGLKTSNGILEAVIVHGEAGVVDGANTLASDLSQFKKYLGELDLDPCIHVCGIPYVEQHTISQTRCYRIAPNASPVEIGQAAIEEQLQLESKSTTANSTPSTSWLRSLTSSIHETQTQCAHSRLIVFNVMNNREGHVKDHYQIEVIYQEIQQIKTQSDWFGFRTEQSSGNFFNKAEVFDLPKRRLDYMRELACSDPSSSLCIIRSGVQLSSTSQILTLTASSADSKTHAASSTHTASPATVLTPAASAPASIQANTQTVLALPSAPPSRSQDEIIRRLAF